MKIRLEHANIGVRELEGMIRFVQTAFPDFRVRGEGLNLQGGRWLHLGDDETYLALNEASEAAGEPWVPYAGKPGLNHLGFEVEDVEALRIRLQAAGYRDSTFPNSHPHRRRVYFYDPEGNDWEFVEYLTEAAEQRNDYAIPDAT